MTKKSDAVKIAEVQAQKEVLLGFAQNPMVALVAGVIILAPLVPAMAEAGVMSKALALIPGVG